MVKSEDRDNLYNKYFEDFETLIENTWILKKENGVDKENVSIDLINKFKIYSWHDEDGEELEIDFIDIIRDIYIIIGLKKDNERKHLKKVGDEYSKLLRLKLFLQTELRECITVIKNNDYNIGDFSRKELKKYSSDPWYFSDSKSKNKHQENIFIRIVQLCGTYSYMFFKNDYMNSYVIEHYSEEKMNENLFWLFIRNNFQIIFSIINSEIEKCENYIFFGDNYVERFNIFFNRIYIENVLDKRIFKNKKVNDRVGCCAFMEMGKERYFTINGIDYTIEKNSKLYKVIDIFKKILGGAEYVQLSDETRYYIDIDNYITYKLYKKNKNMDKSMMRMFTCCEKKLLTVLYNNSYKIEENALQVNLIITREPCKLCERAIEGIEKMFVVNVIYPSPKKSQLPILKFDNYAQSILDSSIMDNENIYKG